MVLLEPLADLRAIAVEMLDAYGEFLGGFQLAIPLVIGLHCTFNLSAEGETC